MKKPLPVAALLNHLVFAVLFLSASTGVASAQFALASGSPFASGAGYPYYSAVADFNKDGRPDLAVIDLTANAVRLYLGNGSGGFTQAAGGPFPVGSSPFSVIAADFNGDGNPDLAISNQASNNVTVLLGNGSASFVAASGSPFATGSGPLGMTVGDFNGDGKLDLAVANFSSNNVTVLTGNGSGGFSAAPGSPFAVGRLLGYVATGDFNGDGKPDLIVSDGDGNVNVLLGNGSGGFSAASGSPYRVGNIAGLATADFNSDGNLDIIFAGAAPGNGAGVITVLLGNGSGHFTTGSTVGVGTVPQGLVLGDFDGDGNTDVAVADEFTAALLKVYLGDGAGGFTQQSGSPYSIAQALANQAFLAVADFNQDGKPDIAVVTGGDQKIAVYLNSAATISAVPVSATINAGAGQSAPAAIPVTVYSQGGLSVSSASNASWLTANTPVNSGGVTTVPLSASQSSLSAGTYAGKVHFKASGQYGAATAVTLSVANPSGTLATASGSPIAAGTIPLAVATGDFNLDGYPDYAVANSVSGTVSIMLGNGSGGFAAASGSPFAVQSSPSFIAVLDVNKDGKPDLAVLNTGSNSVTVLLGNGNGTFTGWTNLTVGTNARAIAVGDFNGDGRPDLAISNSSNNTVTIFVQNSTGTGYVQKADIFLPSGSSPWGIVAADFYGQGTIGLAIANSGSGNVYIFLGNGDGTFGSAWTILGSGSGSRSIVTGDFNGDGWPDLAVSNYGANSVSVFLNVPRSGFNTLSAFSTGAGTSPWGLTAADFNGDGNLDLGIGNANNGTVSIALGNGSGSFSIAGSFPFGTTPASLASADFNRDGRADLAVVNSGSNSVSVLLGASATAVGTLTSTAGSTVAYGIGTPLSLAVSDTGVGFNAPTGTVSFKDGGTTIATTPQGSSPFTVTPPLLAIGVHSLTAVYSGDTRTSAVTSNTLSLTITQATTTTSLASSANPAAVSTAITFTAIVSSPLATGTVTFKDGATTLGTGAVSGGSATFVTSSLNIASHSITAVYGGDSSYPTSTSAALTQIVSPPTSISLTTSATPAAFGAAVTLSATVSPSGATGTLTFKDGAASLGAGAISGGVATLTTSSLRAGLHHIEAVYPGDSTHLAAGSNQLEQSVGSTVSGTFLAASSSPFTTGNGPFRSVVADFNLDGKPDMATINYNDGTVTVLLGNGLGGFTSAPGSPIHVSSTPKSIAVGDFNGDGKPDLVVGDQAANTLYTLLGNGAGGFAGGITLGLERNFSAVVAGDFDSDGKQDLAIAYGAYYIDSALLYFDGKVHFYRGDGAGNFTNTTHVFLATDHEYDGYYGPGYANFGTAVSPVAIATGDFNGDGKLDVAAVTGDGYLWLLNNDGAGNFSYSANGTQVASSSSSLVTADLNGDNILDFAIPDSFNQNVKVILGDGIGGTTQATNSPFPSGFSNSWIAAGDFNGDGHVDLALADGGTNSVKVLLGSGSGSAVNFAAASGGTFPVGSGPVDVAVGDFNADGRLDLAVANQNGNNLSVLLGASAPTTATLTTTATASISPGTSVPLTLTVAETGSYFNSQTGTVTFKDGATVLGTATQSASPYTFTASGLALGSHTFSAVYAGDTRTAGSTSNVITIFVRTAPVITWSNPSSIAYGTPLSATQLNATANVPGTFVYTPAAGTILSVGSGQTLSVTFTPTDTSSYTTATKTTTITVSAASQAISFPVVSGQLLSRGPFFVSAAASSGLPVTLSSTTTPVCKVAGGLVTLLTTGTCTLSAFQGGNASYLPATAVNRSFTVTAPGVSGTLNAALGSPFSGGSQPAALAWADFNGDGAPDLAVANGTSDTVTVLLGNGTGGFSTDAAGPLATGHVPVAVAAGDFNADGKLDLAVANVGAGNVTILLGNGSGGFAQPPGSPFAVGTEPVHIAIADFNGDGAPDLAISYGSTGLRIMLGDGTGAFSQGASLTVAAAPNGLAAGDFNGDGKADVAVVSPDSNALTVLLGNGSGGFSSASGSPFTTGSGPIDVAVGDFNADGKLDIAVANSGDTTVSVFIGNGSGGFTSHIFQAGPGPSGVSVGDLNGDGNTDLAVMDGSGGTTVLLGDGTGGFAAAPGGLLPTGSQGNAIVTADFNQDGKLDVAVTGGTGVAVLLGGLAATTSTLTTTASSTITYGTSVPLTLGVANSGVHFSTLGGTATFKDGSTSLGTGPASGSTLTATSLGAGSHSFTALYGGDNRTAGSTSNTVTIQVNPAAATVSLGSLSFTYDGTPKSATATTNPPGLAVSFTYNGSSTAPKAAGSYAVVATITDPNYSGTASGTLTIGKLTLTPSVTISSKVYNRTQAGTIATRTLPGAVAGDDVSLTGGSATFASFVVGTGINVSVTGLSLSGTAAVNYQLSTTSLNTTGNITPASLTITPSASSKVYDRTNFATVTTSDNRLPGDLFAVYYVGSSFPSKNVGNGLTVTVSNLSITGPDSANYTLSSTSATTTANITAAPLTVTAGGNDKTYDGTTAAAVSFGDNRLNGDSLTETGTAAFSDKNAGNGKTVNVTGISISGPDAGNYSLSNTTASATANITARSLTVTATGVGKTYNGTAAATVTLADNRLAGDSLTDSYTLAAFSDKNLGTGKTVSVTGISISGPDAGNYTLSGSTASTSANITARALTATATGVNKIYDGTISATVTLSDNRVAGDSLTDNYTSAAFADKNVGTGKTVSVSGISLTGPDSGNYSLSNTSASTTANITAKPLTVTATGVNKPYDGIAAASVTLADNRIAGDSLSAGYTSAAFPDKNLGTGKTVSVSGISISGTDSGNYSLTATTASTTANITARPLTVTATGVNKPYDGTIAATVTLGDNRLAGDSLTDNYTSAAFSDRNAGTAKTVSVTGISISGVDSGNYQLSNTTASPTANITARPLTVTATGIDKTYDGTAAATVTLADNRLAGDSLTDNYTTASFPDKNLGTGKTVTVTGISIFGTDSANYALTGTTASTTANITARSLTVTASGINKPYDGTTAATVTLSDNRIAGDSLTEHYSFATFADKNAGTAKSLTATGITISGADAGNYTLTATTVPATANITPRPLTVKISGVDKNYDGTVAATLTLADNRLFGDTLTDGYAAATFSDKNVGNGKAVSVTGIAISGTDAGNYSLNATTGSTTANITAIPLTVTATGVNKSYDGTAAATVTLSDNRISGDSLTDSYTMATFSDKNLGSARPVSVTGISISGPDSGNYSLTGSTAATTASITARTLTVTATGVNKSYDGTVTATVTLSDNRLPGDSLTPGYTSATFSDKNAGTGKTVGVTGISIAGTDSGNYSLTASTASTTANISVIPLTVTATGVNKGYDGTATATVTLSDNRLVGDSLTDNYTAASFADGNAGTAKTVSVTGISISGADSGNYHLSGNTASAVANISKASASVAPNAASKTYGQSDPVFSGTLTGFLAADNVTAAYSRNTGETVAGSPYTISATLSPAGVLANYNIAYNTANFTIGKAPATVTVNAGSKTYSQPDPAFTGTLAGFLPADNITATYTRAPGETVAGSPYTISATLSPASALANYSVTYNSAALAINKATPVITWIAPVAITFGSALGAGQLNAVSSVPGTLVYSPPAGTVLPAGNGQTLSVTLSPSDAADYNPAVASTTINVNPAGGSSGSAASLVVTRTLARGTNTIVVQLTIANNGGTDATGVTLTNVKVGTATATPLPQNLGTIAAGGSVTTTVTVPGSTGSPGAASTLTVSGTYNNGGALSSTARITLP